MEYARNVYAFYTNFANFCLHSHAMLWIKRLREYKKNFALTKHQFSLSASLFSLFLLSNPTFINFPSFSLPSQRKIL